MTTFTRIPSNNMGLERWKDEEEEDVWSERTERREEQVGKGKQASPSKMKEPLKASRTSERSKRAVTSESWDDDFLFQHDPTSTAGSSSCPPSRSSRPITPSSPHRNSLLIPSRPLPTTLQTSARNRHSPPSSPSHRSTSDQLCTMSNPSLDSLVSSIDWSNDSLLSDHEPTLTIDPVHASATPEPLSQSMKKPSIEFRPKHVPNLSTSTARPPTSTSQRTISQPPLAPTSTNRTPSSSSSNHKRRPQTSRTPSTTSTLNRSETPSLTADSLRSLAWTTGDELRTETEGDTSDGERKTVVQMSTKRPRSGLFGMKRYSREVETTSNSTTTSELRPNLSKRWKFGRGGGKKEGSEVEASQGGVLGRRVGPREIETTTSEEINPYLTRSGLPLPKRDGQFIVLGRRTRTSVGTISVDRSSIEAVDGAPVRPPPSSRHKHSRNDTVSTVSSTTSSTRQRPRPQSLQFQPMSFDQPPRLSRSIDPRRHQQASWREYDGTASPDDGADETTEGELSEFSGDERFDLSRLNERRRTIAVEPSTRVSRPGSPVESILGDRVGRWNTSQVSFASSASAFGLPSPPLSTSPPANEPPTSTSREGTVKNQKRKLVKKRPDDAASSSTSPPSLSIEDVSGQRPLLSVVSSRSSGSSNALTSSKTSPRLPASSHHQSPSLPFAQDSDLEVPQRPKAIRRRSNTAPSNPAANERGEVVELGKEWLGVVPFPPSPRASLDSRPPPLPPTPSSSSLRSPSRIFRKVSGNAKTHPPITGQNQGGTKSSKRTSGTGGSGIGQSISNLLSRSTSALPLGGGKRAASPAPSTKSGKSSRSVLSRTGSWKGKSTVRGGSPTKLPKSPSIATLKTSTSRSRPPISSSSSLSKAATKAPQRSTSSVDTFRPSEDAPASPSLLSRARQLSRSRTSKGSPSKPIPPSPIKPSSSATPRPTRPTVVASRESSSQEKKATTQVTPKGQLNTSFRMRRNAGEALSATPTEASRSTSSTLRPLPNGTTTTVNGKRGPPPQTRSAQAGHRPSLSLSSIMRSLSPSPRALPPPLIPTPSMANSPTLPSPPTPHERCHTSLGNDRPPTSYYFDEDLVHEFNFVLPRRNSLGDLKIPARITNAQKKIEEDLERVKQFAQGIEDLKSLRRQYDQLVRVLVEPPPVGYSSPRSSIDLQPVSSTISKAARGVRRVEIDHASWWEQAKTLIDLGDGKTPDSNTRTSPGTLASRRDRCISLAPEASPSKGRERTSTMSGSETETEETFSATSKRNSMRPGGLLWSAANGGNNGSTRLLARVPSASSIETEASLEARQREMLRGVLAPTIKGASLPSRAPSSPRPSLAVLAQVEVDEDSTSPRSPSISSPSKRPPFGLSYPSSPSTARVKAVNNRRVSRVGVSGIREFLLRLRSRATQELANSVGALPPSLDPASTTVVESVPPRRSVSDPTSRPSTPSQTRQPTPSSRLQKVAASDPNGNGRRKSTSSSGSDEDWDAELAPPSSNLLASPSSHLHSSSPLRGRALSIGESSSGRNVKGIDQGGGGGGGGKEMMILTTENMPRLLEKIREVKERCEGCVEQLKGLSL